MYHTAIWLPEVASLISASSQQTLASIKSCNGVLLSGTKAEAINMEIITVNGFQGTVVNNQASHEKEGQVFSIGRIKLLDDF